MTIDKDGLASLLERLRSRPGEAITRTEKLLDQAADAIASLQQANAALISERTSLVATKREQIDALTSRAQAAEASLASAREANRKLHRRAQLAEAVSQATIGQLASWLTYLGWSGNKERRRRDRHLVLWIVRDIKRIAEKLQARSLQCTDEAAPTAIREVR